ncbi:UDP-N-acetylmuramoyl-L-alanyl-D-glutamate--2,6-diaminopimelate ligase [Mycoplasmatota bacterium zrk1]
MLEKIDVNIKHITQNSKRVRPGSLFISMNDLHLSEAIENGASAIISNKNLKLDIPTYRANPKVAYAEVLKEFYHHNLFLVGITGTDGKTTTSSIVKHLLGNECGIIGTNGIKYKDKKLESKLTTPILEDIYKYLNIFQKEKIETAVLEASSEGIIDNRINGLNFDICIFTNLSHEHLNTHKNMSNYFQSKLKLFKEMKRDGIAVINIDDDYFKELNESIDNPIITYGTNKDADFQIVDIRHNDNLTSFTLKNKNNSYEITTNLLGKYNIYNITAALIAAGKQKDINTLIPKLNNIPEIEGRFVHVKNDKEINVVVDFAHTPNAIKNLLETINIRKKGNSILVIGAAGEKDKTKRKTMGKIATENSDFVVFTSEDPKFEDESKIIEDLLKEVTSENYIKIYDRKEAIRAAIHIARMNDTVIITGKGNEQYMKKNNKLTKHNDIEIAREFIKKKE